MFDLWLLMPQLSFLQNLKILRHPSILKYHESFENSKGITIVTEPVCPLECVIETLDLTEIISGLFDILGALVFLHEKASVAKRIEAQKCVLCKMAWLTWKINPFTLEKY